MMRRSQYELFAAVSVLGPLATLTLFAVLVVRCFVGCGPADGVADADLSRVQLPLVTCGFAKTPQGGQRHPIVLDGKTPDPRLSEVTAQDTVLLLADRNVEWRELEQAALTAAGRGARVALAVLTQDKPPVRAEIPVQVKLPRPVVGIIHDDLPRCRLDFTAGPDGSLERVNFNYKNLGRGPEAIEHLTQLLTDLPSHSVERSEVYVCGGKTLWGDVAPLLSATLGTRAADRTVHRFPTFLTLGQDEGEIKSIDEVMPGDELLEELDSLPVNSAPLDLLPVEKPPLVVPRVVFEPDFQLEKFLGDGPEPRFRRERVIEEKGIRTGPGRNGESQVAQALKWLAEHQLPDGNWSYDHRGGKCQGRCRNHGQLADAKIAATAQALLPFLAAGQTHTAGTYKKAVQSGLAYLLRSMKVDGEIGIWEEAGGTPSHAMASVAVCEAYALTNDRGLQKPAELAINHIAKVQEPMDADARAWGWRLTALRSAQIASLKVPPEPLALAAKRLDLMTQEEDEITAVALLGRMYLGAKPSDPAIAARAKWLAGRGPNVDRLSAMYFGTQARHHVGGDGIREWNNALRKKLLEAQGDKAHETGSWYFRDDPAAQAGGRLYCTSLAVLSLEVYYRHLPIYGKSAVGEK